MTPINAATDVPINTLINIQLNEPINTLSISPANIYLRDNTLAKTVEANIGISADGQEISLTPTVPLAVNRAYTLNVANLTDLAGNTLSSVGHNFTTGFSSDIDAPAIIAIGIDENQINVPRNARIRILFNKPINTQKLAGVELRLNGLPVKIDKQISSDQLLLTIKPNQILQSNTNYQLALNGIHDLSGNAIATPITRNFFTSTQTDIVTGLIGAYSPSYYSSKDVPLNARIEVILSEPIDPISVKLGAFVLTNSVAGKDVVGDVDISADKKRLSFVPVEPLQPGQKYTFSVGKRHPLYDLAGNIFNVSSDTQWFITGTKSNSKAPEISLSTFVDGAIGVPINPQINITLNEPLNETCINEATVRLVRKSDGYLIEGIVHANVYGNANRFSFIPRANLEPSTEYELLYDGVCDLSGDRPATNRLSFTTGVSSVVDTTPPTLKSVSPTSGQINVSTKSKIIVEFNEPIDATSIEFRFSAVGLNSWIPGGWEQVGNQYIFTPLSDLPGSTRIELHLNSVFDLAGNEYSPTTSASTFYTAPGTDTTPPRVESITPENGSIDIGPSTPIVITFTEALLESTINGSNIVLYIDGKIVEQNLYRSDDNRTVTISTEQSTPLPSGKLITVLVGKGVTDMVGNPAVDFASTFTTSIVNSDSIRPSVIRQSPVTGAVDVRNQNYVLLYSNKKLDFASVPENVFVSVNGSLISGIASLDESKQIISFTPDSPISENALVEVSVTDNLFDVSGNRMNGYKGSFRTGSNSGSTVGAKPSVSAIYPVNGQTGTVLNPLIELLFNEPIKPSSINSSTIQFRKITASGVILPSSISVSGDRKVVRIVPSSVLEKNTKYFINLLPNIEDIDGDKTTASNSYSFTTGTDAVEDNQQVIVTATSPGDGAAGVPINPWFHVGFDEPIHPLSIPKNGKDQISFLAGNQDVRYLKDQPLSPNTDVQEVFSGFLDRSGNLLVDKTVSFKTSDEVDSKPPIFPIATTPAADDINVPVNTTIEVIMNEALSSLTISSSNVYLTEWLAAKVPTTLSVSSDGRVLRLVPNAPLKPNTEFSVVILPVVDIANNKSDTFEIRFTTGAAADVSNPQVLNTSVDGNPTNIPMNARISVRFSEPVNINKLDGVELLADGVSVPVQKNLGDEGYYARHNRVLLTLTPIQMLQPGKNYQLRVSGIEDFSGNQMGESIERIFNASASTEISALYTVSRHPVPGSTVVDLNSLIEIKFTKELDLTNSGSNSIVVRNTTNNEIVSGAITLSGDRKSLIFTPAAGLKPGKRYTVYYAGSNAEQNIYDIVGRYLTSGDYSFYTGN